jgi:hypothetical protein
MGNYSYENPSNFLDMNEWGILRQVYAYRVMASTDPNFKASVYFDLYLEFVTYRVNASSKNLASRSEGSTHVEVFRKLYVLELGFLQYILKACASNTEEAVFF